MSVTALPGTPDPGPRIPASSRADWAVSTGDDPRWPRGVYTRRHDGHPWRRVAPLPDIRARVRRRDGAGRSIGMDVLMASGPDAPAVLVDWRSVRDGSWASTLCLPLSGTPEVVQAAATAILTVADGQPLQEATVRVGTDGRITTPVPEALPPGYLPQVEVPEDECRERLAELIFSVAGAPIAALMLGASAWAPWVRPLRRQSHFLHVHYPEGGNGKSTALKAAAWLWGDPWASGGESEAAGGALVRSWDSSSIGTGRFLGELGILPGFFDESGTQGGAADWGQTIYRVCEGNTRLTAEARGAGIKMSRPWGGILFTAGNAGILSTVNASRYAGAYRRVVELHGKPMPSARLALAVKELTQTAGGSIGRILIDSITRDTAREMVRESESWIGLSEDDGERRTIAEHLAGAITGARFLDQIAGTATVLTEAVLSAALDHMTEWQRPDTGGALVLAAVADELARHPAAWPDLALYRAMQAPADGVMPLGGVERQMSGVLLHSGEDGSRRVAVFARTWTALCSEVEADPADVAAQLHRAGRLSVPTGAGRRREWQTQVRLLPRPAAPARVYVLELPGEPVSPEVAPEGGHGSGTGVVTGRSRAGHGDEIRPLTSVVTVVTGESAAHPHVREAETPVTGRCRTCGGPTEAWRAADGLECWPCLDRARIGRLRADTPASSTAPAPADPGPALPLDQPEARAEALEAPERPAAPAPAPEAAPGRQRGTGRLRAVPADGPDPAQVPDLVACLADLGIEVTTAQGADVLAHWHRATGGAAWTSRRPAAVGLAMLAATTGRSGTAARGLLQARRDEVMPDGWAHPMISTDHVDPTAPINSGTECVSEFDINGQFLSAAGIALGTSADPLEIKAPRKPESLVKLPGYVRLASDHSCSDPALMGRLSAGTVLPMPIAQYMVRHLDMRLDLDAALVWQDGQHRPHLAAWQGRMRAARADLMAAEGPGARVALKLVKSVSAALLGGMLASTRANRSQFLRPDWTHMVKAEAKCRQLIAVRRIREAGGLVSGAFMDAIIVPSTGPGDTPPTMQVSDQLGKWKLSRHVAVSESIITAYETGSASSLNKAIKNAAEV